MSLSSVGYDFIVGKPVLLNRLCDEDVETLIPFVEPLN